MMIRSNSSRAIGVYLRVWDFRFWILDLWEGSGPHGLGDRDRDGPETAGLLLHQPPERGHGVVLEDTEPIPRRRPRQPELLVFESRQRIQVVAHDPGIGDMGRGRHQVGPVDRLGFL